MRIVVILFGFLLLPGSRVYGNFVGTDFQAFNPSTSGLDFVTVQSSETLYPCIFNFGLFVNYGINGLPDFSEGKLRRVPRGEKRNSVTGADFNVGMGLTNSWDFGVSFPATLAQTTEEDGVERLQYAEEGINEIRVNTKYRFWGKRSYGVAAIGTVSYNTIAGNPLTGDNAPPIFALEVAGDTTLGPVALAANLGYRWRTPGDEIEGVPFEPFGNQIIYSGAASFHVKAINTKLIGEIFASTPHNDDEEDAQELQKSSEGLLGAKIQLSDNMAFHVGGSTFLEQASATPDYRVYSGMNVTFGPVCGEKKKLKRKRRKHKAVKGGGYTQEGDTFVIDHINFKFDSDFEVNRGAKDTLQKVLDRIRSKNKTYRIIVEGHTDSFGTRESNHDLGQRRADRVKSYLVRIFDLDPERIETISYGEDQPIADNGNYQGRLENRRVEIRITAEDGTSDF